MTHDLTLEQLHAEYLSASICRAELERVAPLYRLSALHCLVDEARQAETECWREYRDAVVRIKADIDAFMACIDHQELHHEHPL